MTRSSMECGPVVDSVKIVREVDVRAFAHTRAVLIGVLVFALGCSDDIEPRDSEHMTGNASANAMTPDASEYADSDLATSRRDMASARNASAGGVDMGDTVDMGALLDMHSSSNRQDMGAVDMDAVDMKAPDDSACDEVCGEDEYSSGVSCVACPPGTINGAGDDPCGAPTACEPVLCEANERVESHRCVPCTPDRTNTSGDSASGLDTECDGERCATNEHVLAGACAPCAPGSQRPGGDDPLGMETACEAILCGGDQRVSAHECVMCPPGSTAAPGADTTGDDTECTATLCLEDERVVAHQCVPCPAGMTSPAGADATGADTLCDAPASGVNAIMVSAGRSHTCAVTVGGGVKCWGRNNNGQLGDGTLVDRTSPVDVTGLSTGVSAVAAGSDHTCALLTNGGVKCWGGNYSGQLGDGTNVRSAAPVSVSGVSAGVVQVVTGWTHTCARTSTGRVECWGDNYSAQLGDGTTTERRSPTQVVSSGAEHISAGGAHTCALFSVTGVSCWGRNSDGQLGTGTRTRSTVPVLVSPPMPTATYVAVGKDHTCATTSNASRPKCWGFGYTEDPTTVVNEGYDAVSLTLGKFHTCSLDSTNQIDCWGSNSKGQLGAPGANFTAISLAAGWEHTCAVEQGGVVKCWGHNEYGQLGDGTTIDRSAPVDVGSP